MARYLRRLGASIQTKATQKLARTDTPLFLDTNVPDLARDLSSIESSFESQSKDDRVVKGFLSVSSNRPRAVAVKITLHTPDGKTMQKFLEELSIWASLSHSHILPLLGAAYVNGYLSMVSPWMEHGSLVEYIAVNPTAPRAEFLPAIASALEYLHTSKPAIVHGDVKASNIIVDNRKKAYLCDFGLSTRVTAASQPKGGSTRWMAPELFTSGDTVGTPSDVYSFGLTSLEIMTGEVPFPHFPTDVVPVHAMFNKPEKPAAAHDELWAVLTRCWNTAPERPTMTAVLIQVKRIVERSLENLPPWNVARHQSVAVETDSGRISFPTERTALDLSDRVERGRLIGYGAKSNIYEASWKRGSDQQKLPTQAIAIRQLRTYSTAREGLEEKHWRREITVWNGLDHPNVLALFGFALLDGEGSPHKLSLVMPRMDYSVRDYIAKYPSIDRMKLISQIAEGLNYLHHYNPVVVHGNLTTHNVLVRDEGNPYISDFGLSCIGHEPSWVTMTSVSCGSARWLAPEILRSETLPSTKEGDIYAYAMTSFEILTSTIPFIQYARDAQVAIAVAVRGEIPITPNEIFIHSHLWELLQICWNVDPKMRPGTQSVLQHIRKIKDSVSREVMSKMVQNGDPTNVSHVWSQAIQCIGNHRVRARLEEGSRIGDWNAKLRCFPGTRLSSLERIMTWSCDQNQPNICWVKGRSGTGKSTICHEVAALLEEQSRVFSCFFFPHNSISESSSALHILALGLLSRSKSLAIPILEAMKDHATKLASMYSQQFHSLLLSPLVQFGLIEQPIVLIIDGLDSCPKRIRLALTDAILHSLHDLPANVKVLLSLSTDNHEKLAGSPTKSVDIDLDSEDAQVELVVKDELVRMLESKQLIHDIEDSDRNIEDNDVSSRTLVRPDTYELFRMSESMQLIHDLAENTVRNIEDNDVSSRTLVQPDKLSPMKITEFLSLHDEDDDVADPPSETSGISTHFTWSYDKIDGYVNALSKKAAGNFQLVRTACLLLNNYYYPNECLDQLMGFLPLPQSDSIQKSLDDLYTFALRTCLASHNSEDGTPNTIWDRFRQLMKHIITAEEPSTLKELITMEEENETPEGERGMGVRMGTKGVKIGKDNHVLVIIQSLNWIFVVETHNGEYVPKIAHTSFFDFLCDSRRCTDPDLYISLGDQT